MLSYTTVEVEEDVSNSDNQYIAPSLPTFRKNANPLSKLDGSTVFTQDETNRLEHFDFQGQPAAAVLANEVELCRVNHAGHILRQRIEIERCALVKYCYRHTSKEYSIYINPEHRLVEDLDGPVQSFIENTHALAQEAFKEKRHEEAYRLITRGLCMDEATEAEKKLRDEILQALLASYRKIALASWSCAAIVWCLASGPPSRFHISWWFVLGLIPLLLGIQLFAEDLGVRLSGPKDRTVPAVSIGIAAFLSGIVIGAGTSGTDWLGLASLTAVVGALGLFRSNVRAKLQKLEAFFPTFPSPQALETYVLTLDPKPELSSRLRVVLVALVALLAAQPMVKLASGIITASSTPVPTATSPPPPPATRAPHPATPREPIPWKGPQPPKEAALPPAKETLKVRAPTGTTGLMTTSMALAEAWKDFGTVSAGTVLEHIIIVRNTGPEPIVLSTAQSATPDAVTTELLDLTVPPQGEGRIRLFLNTGSLSGRFRSSVNIADSQSRTVTFYIMADVGK